MKHTDFREAYDEIKTDELITRFADWSADLVSLLEKRVFGGQFQEIMNFSMSIDEQPVSRLTDEEKEEQLTICSQYKFTFRQMHDELDLYLAKVERSYRSWLAPLYIGAQVDIIKAKDKLFVAKVITKASVTFTKDEVQNRFLIVNEIENVRWHDFMDHVKRAKSLMKNVADDMESRSMILMNLRKRQTI